MDQTGYILLSRLTAQLRGTDVLANNMANTDTPGYHAIRPIFAQRMQQQRGVVGPVGGASVARPEPSPKP